MIEAFVAIGVFLVLWMFFNPIEPESVKAVLSTTHRHDDNLAQGAMILIIGVMLAFALFGSVP